jgi:hypothetical protein
VESPPYTTRIQRRESGRIMGIVEIGQFHPKSGQQSNCSIMMMLESPDLIVLDPYSPLKATYSFKPDGFQKICVHVTMDAIPTNELSNTTSSI